MFWFFAGRDSKGKAPPRAPELGLEAPEGAFSSLGDLDEKQRSLLRDIRPRAECPLAVERTGSVDPANEVWLQIGRVRDGCLVFIYEIAGLADLAERMTTIRREPDVAAVSPLVWRPTLELLAPPDKTEAQWALPRLGVPPPGDVAWPDGEGVRIAVIDAGIDGDHPDLISQGVDGSAHRAVVSRYPLRNDPGGDLGADEKRGHGTFVAGIIAAAANNKMGFIMS